ncbi:MAG TPA: hypothetical protein VL443_26190 [Cyclobacteriaceae bacterium]|jgi:hypothetical protein|nr:hypothetical protein [Cyclobacteriaceae bacterium]
MKLLELHFSQLSKIWNRSKNNTYSDTSRKSYHNKLKKLYEQLEKEKLSLITDKNEIKEKKAILAFFSESIAFLDNSTVNTLPFELVKCLEIALNEWLAGEDYIIVTSLAKGLNEFSFNPSLATNYDQYEIIRSNYKIEFEKKLIQINIPEYLVGDYLANVIMYHELGHFIEVKYSIPDVILKEFLDDYSNKRIKADFHIYFPFVRKRFSEDGIYSDECLTLLKTHIGEYFCDLFASQYIDDSVNHYLSYISEENSITKLHPTTRNRIKLVNSFLNNQSSYTLDKIKYAIKQWTEKDLTKRYKVFNSNDFIKLLPVDIKHEKELHYLFIYGWSIWLKSWKKIEKENKMVHALKAPKVYEILNDLIEKSIGNYIVKTTWENVSSKKANRKKA